MTTIIVLRCQNGLVVASDSQATAEKITSIKQKIFVPPGGNVLITGAGDSEQIKEFVGNVTCRDEYEDIKDVKKEVAETLARFMEPVIPEGGLVSMPYYSRQLCLLYGAILRDKSICVYHVNLDPNNYSITLVQDAYFIHNWYVL
ncbi:MAG TPA: hypothetical protein VFV86_07380 [Nitrososphaeraceae archaeon]|nr:hypothetical protein [Nitrososphaeraceae archaeon]